MISIRRVPREFEPSAFHLISECLDMIFDISADDLDLVMDGISNGRPRALDFLDHGVCYPLRIFRLKHLDNLVYCFHQHNGLSYNSFCSAFRISTPRLRVIAFGNCGVISSIRATML